MQDAPREKGHYFRSLIDNIHEDIIVIDRNYVVTDVNGRLSKTTGKSRGQAIGRHCYEVTHDLDVHCEEKGEDCPLQRVFAEGQARSCRHRHRHADGSTRTVDILLSPLRDKEGEVSHVIEAMRDVSDLVVEEEASISHLSTFPELNPNPVLEIDEAGKVMYMNPVSKKLFPGLQELGTKHPFLDGWSDIRETLRNRDTIIRDVQVGGSWYEQGIAFVPITGSYHIYGRDVTEHREARIALEKSEEKYRMFFDNAGDAVILWDMSDPSRAKVLDANKVACNRYNYSHEEMLKLTGEDLNTPESTAGREATFDTLLRGGPATYERIHRDKHGRSIPVEVSGHLFELDGRKVVLSVIRDITERKEAEKALRKSEERYRQLFNVANDAIFVHHPTNENQPGKFIEINEVACRLLGYSRQQLMQMTAGDIVRQKKGVPTPHQVINKLFESRTLTVDSCFTARDGHPVPIELNAHLFYLDGRPTIMSIARDITKRLQGEKELRQKERHIRDLAAAYVRAQEEEREWMALEIHDRIIQPVLAVHRSVEPLLSEGQSGAVRQALNEAMQLTRDTITEARQLTRQLYPTTLSRYGLVRLMNEELGQLEQQTGLNSNISVAGWPTISNQLQTALYRVFHEAILNISKHSGASEVNVSLSGSRGAIQMTIQDNGAGFDVRAKSRDKSPRGLQSMRRRTELMGGSFRMTSTPGKGTNLKIKFPVSNLGDEESRD